MFKLRMFSFIITLILFIINFSQAQKAAKSSALEKLNLKTYSTLKTADGRINAKTGAVRYLYNQKTSGFSGNPEQIARSFLNERAENFSLKKEDLSLKTIRSRITPGGSHVLFEQEIKGIPVYASNITVTINNSGEVTFVASAYRSVQENLNTNPAISENQAITTARNYLNVSGKMLGRGQRAKLMFFESADAGFELSWRVILPTEKPLGDWEVFVNTLNGRIIHARDLRMCVHDGAGLIWDPDPLTTAGVEYGGEYKDNNDADSDALNNQRLTATLRDLTYEGGLYKLQGPYAVLYDHESPSDNFPELDDSSAFNYTRNQQEFEDVMVYYHIDLSTRHLILDLGYDDPKQREFQADPHGLNGDDNSHYMTSENYVAFGEGGVDDAEDADVIWHEHAHSFQTNLTGGMSYSGETMSLQEGSSDYWAASSSRIINDYNWGYVFTWDGHNEFWSGRRCDLDWIYPDDYVSGHDGGQIWSSALMDIWADLGREITDKLFIETHYIWGYAPGLQDAAEAFIQANENLYGGTHKSVIIEHFNAHGLVDKNDYMPTIEHTPLTETEESQSGYEVVAIITPGANPLNEDSLLVVHGVSALDNTLLMIATGSPDEYSAVIPPSGTNIDIYYYIKAVDTGGGVGLDPANAPTEYHSFHVGPDEENPVISHAPLSDQPLEQWPATVSATVTDNSGVDTVICYYHVNSSPSDDSFPLLLSGNDLYEGDFTIPASELNIGDMISYYISARDISQNQNTSREPASGYITFEIIDTKGLVLIVDDDGASKNGDTSGKGEHTRTKDSYGKSADQMQIWLDELGYTTEKMTVALALNADFSSYNLIISSSGANMSPVADANYRDKLETWVSDAAHKLLIEGGEVGYDAANTPGYPTFASNVIHSTDWDADNAGNLSLHSGYESHPMVTTPNALPSSISITYSGYGDQDSQKPEGTAYILYGSANYTNNACVLIYDTDEDNTTAQTVYYAFNFDALPNDTDAKNLLDNTVAFLVATETPAGAISGTVDLTDNENDSGVSVYISGLKSDTTFTDASGYYIFSELEDSEYAVKVYKEGYTTNDSIISGFTVSGDTVKDVNFILDPIVSDFDDITAGETPKVFKLQQNYPNPFNPVTTIKYQLENEGEVELALYNLLGQRVQTLVRTRQQAGFYSFNYNASHLSSGVYLLHIKAGTFVQVRKIVLMK